MGGRNYNRNRRGQAILTHARPLVAARGKLDVIYKEQEQDILRRFRNGENAHALLGERFSSPAQEEASLLLSQLVSSRDHDWLEWFSLRTCLQTAEQRVFSTLLFSHISFSPLRRELHDRAYTAYGRILGEAIDVLEVTTNPEDRQKVRGAIGELTILALLNRTNQRRSGAHQSKAYADRYHKVDARYRFWGVGRAHPTVVSIQSSTWDKDQELGNKVYGVTTVGILDTPGDTLHNARLIRQEADGASNPEAQARIATLSSRIKSTLHNQILQDMPAE